MTWVLAITAGCPGDDSGSEEAGGSESAESSTGTSTGTTDSGSSTGSSGSETESETDETETSTGPDTGGELCESMPTEPQAAVLEVIVTVHNDTDETYYMIDFGEFCDPFGISQGMEALPLEIAAPCGCECPAPPSPMASLMELPSGQSHEVRWDGRALATYQARFECDLGECLGEPSGQPQPVAPGTLTMTLPIYDDPDFEFPLEPAGVFAQRCAAPLTYDLALELGTEDLQFDIMLSEIVP